MPTQTIQSKCVEDSVECPSCGHRDKVFVWDLLEASANPEQAARLATGELFVHACSSCGAKIPLDYPLLYIDRDARTCAYYPAGTGELPALTTAFAQATIKFRGIDLSSLRRGEYTMRVAPERYQLVEKVAIWRAGLDDELVEVLKASLLDELNGRDGGCRFHDAQFARLAEDGEKIEFLLFEGDGEDDGPRASGISVPLLAYRRIAATLDICANIGLRHSPVVDQPWARDVLAAARADAMSRER